MKIRGVSLGIAILISAMIIQKGSEMPFWLFVSGLILCLLNWHNAFDNGEKKK